VLNWIDWIHRGARTSTVTASENEATILARVLGNERGQLSAEMAHHILEIGFSDRDKARIKDLSMRNQDGALSESEKEELFA
jgi:hypothetical protein